MINELENRSVEKNIHTEAQKIQTQASGTCRISQKSLTYVESEGRKEIIVQKPYLHTILA